MYTYYKITYIYYDTVLPGTIAFAIQKYQNMHAIFVEYRHRVPHSAVVERSWYRSLRRQRGEKPIPINVQTEYLSVLVITNELRGRYVSFDFNFRDSFNARRDNVLEKC